MIVSLGNMKTIAIIGVIFVLELTAVLDVFGAFGRKDMERHSEGMTG